MTYLQQRSTFVTALAWIFIVLSGFTTIISILQNILVFTMSRSSGMGPSMQAPLAQGMPPAAAFLANHIQLFFLAFLLVSAFAFVSSIGLLMRQNWARLCFIGFMAFAIAWQLGGLALQFSMFPFMRQQFSAPATQGGPDMLSILIAIAVVSVLFTIGFTVLFGWITKRLLSPAIVAEFRR